jgi:hypothetical protein
MVRSTTGIEDRARSYLPHALMEEFETQPVVQAKETNNMRPEIFMGWSLA